MSIFGNGEFGNRTIFHFYFKWKFNNWAVAVIASATTAAFAAGAFMAPANSSDDLVPVGVTSPSSAVSVCLKHDNISFVLYRSMC